MSTRSTIKIIENDNVNYLYSHWDGYPEGTGQKLRDALIRVHEVDDDRLPPFVNAFIAANISNCEIISNADEYSVDYRYVVNLSNNTISTNGRDVMAIEDFLFKHINEDWVYTKKYDIGLINWDIKNSLLYKLNRNIGKALTWKNFLTNPNYINWKEQKDFLNSLPIS